MTKAFQDFKNPVQRFKDDLNPFKTLQKDMGNVKDAFSSPGGLTPAEVPERGANDPAIAKRATEQFATRELGLQRQAAAAGAQRSENDADLLGFKMPKLRSASRALLG